MSSSILPDPIIPGQYGGFRQDSTSEDREFPAYGRRKRGHCRIVALLGPDNYEGRAAPNKDGWIISDFYYLHHILSRTTTSQQWLTCLAPEDLVQQYGPFIHRGAESSDDLLFVLDEKICPKLRRVKVHPIEHLLPQFLAAIHEQSRIALEQNQHLVLIVFGHGTSDTGSVFIGSRERPRPRTLKIQMISDNVVRGTDLIIINTACFSGKWVESPKLNATVFAAAPADRSSYSWRFVMKDRAPGSHFISAFVAALMAGDEGEETDLAMTSDRAPFQGSQTLASWFIYDIPRYSKRELQPNYVYDIYICSTSLYGRCLSACVRVHVCRGATLFVCYTQ